MKRQREVEHAQKWSIEGGEGKGVIDCDYVKDWMGKSWSGVGWERQWESHQEGVEVRREKEMGVGEWGCMK